MPSANSSAAPKAAWLARSDRLMGVSATLLGICALGLAIGLLSLSRAHEHAMDHVTQTRAARIAVYTLMQGSIDAEAGQRGYLLTGDASFLEPYERGRAVALQQLATLRGLSVQIHEIESEVARADGLARSAFDALERTLVSDRMGILEGRALRQQLQSSKAQMDAVRAKVTGILREVEGLVEEAWAQEGATRAALYWVGGVLAILALGACTLTLAALRIERRSWAAALQALSAANEAAEQARAAAAASDLAKTRFLAVASHDMRQPLHALTLYTSALQRRIETGEAREILAKMERATQSMVGMFATLLDLARIQANVIKPEKTGVPVQDLIDGVVAEHPGGLVAAAPTHLAIRTDAQLMARILSNLASNAVKHGGGARIEVSQTGADVEIAVVDDGPGIPPEEHARIFDEFVRLDGRRGEGLGLGLAIVKRIADLLGVAVRVDSSPGRGARFVVRAPLAKHAQHAPARQGFVALAGVSAIVLDDDPLAREAVAGALRDLGASVAACANEAELEAAFSGGARPALLFLDLRIDGKLQGLDIAARVRAKLDTPPAVIILTGDTAADTLAALKASGHRWLIKPVESGALGAAAAEAIGRAEISVT